MPLTAEYNRAFFWTKLLEEVSMWEAQSFNRTPALNDSLFQENKKTHLILDFSLVLKLFSRLILFNSLIWSSRAVPFQISLTQAGWDRPWYI